MALRASVETVTRSPPVTALFSETVTSITDKMLTNNIGAIIIMSGGAPAGIVTERDIIKAVRDGKDLAKTRAQEIMSTPLLSIETNRTVRDALEIMREKKIRRLAITKNGRLIGIVTERRLLDSMI